MFRTFANMWCGNDAILNIFISSEKKVSFGMNAHEPTMFPLRQLNPFYNTRLQKPPADFFAISLSLFLPLRVCVVFFRIKFYRVFARSIVAISTFNGFETTKGIFYGWTELKVLLFSSFIVSFRRCVFLFRNSHSQLHMQFMRQRVNLASKHLGRGQPWRAKSRESNGRKIKTAWSNHNTAHIFGKLARHSECMEA